jgi:transposase
MRVVPRYDEQFKDSAIALLERPDRTLAGVARDLGVSEWTLRDWYNKRRMGKKKGKAAKGSTVAAKPGLETAEQRLARLERENAALRRENESLKMDREILKKAAAFFVKESE